MYITSSRSWNLALSNILKIDILSILQVALSRTVNKVEKFFDELDANLEIIDDNLEISIDNFNKSIDDIEETFEYVYLNRNDVVEILGKNIRKAGESRVEKIDTFFYLLAIKMEKKVRAMDLKIDEKIMDFDTRMAERLKNLLRKFERGMLKVDRTLIIVDKNVDLININIEQNLDIIEACIKRLPGYLDEKVERINTNIENNLDIMEVCVENLPNYLEKKFYILLDELDEFMPVFLEEIIPVSMENGLDIMEVYVEKLCSNIDFIRQIIEELWDIFYGTEEVLAWHELREKDIEDEQDAATLNMLIYIWDCIEFLYETCKVIVLGIVSGKYYNNLTTGLNKLKNIIIEQKNKDIIVLKREAYEYIATKVTKSKSAVYQRIHPYINSEIEVIHFYKEFDFFVWEYDIAKTMKVYPLVLEFLIKKNYPYRVVISFEETLYIAETWVTDFGDWCVKDPEI